MKLVNYEVVDLPKVALRHNLGDKLGMAVISEALAESYTDEIAHECVKHGLPYFKKKEGVEAKKVKVEATPSVTTAKKSVAKSKVTAPVVEPETEVKA
jgi:hypothetical protein